MKKSKLIVATLIVIMILTVSASAVSTVQPYNDTKTTIAGFSRLEYSEGGFLWWLGTNTAETTTEYTSTDSYYPVVDAYSYLRYFDYENNVDVSDFDDYSSLTFSNGDSISLSASIYKRYATNTSTWVYVSHDQNSAFVHKHDIKR
ncbi:MAG: hypothetical protein IJU46_08415 [Clostridia bacterium]|nr:hypothetical protein [Clostridia bacterium]